MEKPTPLFTDENPSYADKIEASIRQHPAGKGLTKISPTTIAPKPVRNFRRVK
jgi:hypothetical protein